MRLFRLWIVLSAIGSLTAAWSANSADSKEPRKISMSVLEDKIRGGWAGQMIGVSYGAPTEFRSNGKINEAELKWSPERVSNAIQQDDLYVEMTFAEVLDREGLEATSEQFGEMFKDSKYSLWHANAAGRRLLSQGIKAPLSGDPRYNVHANDIDFQIESDFIGLMTPGLPQEANTLCERAGRVMNWGDGLYGGMFFGGMYAAAFFETDARKVVEQGLACIPAQSEYGRLIGDLLQWSANNPDDWRKTWQLIEDKWDKNDACPDGSFSPFNIDAKINGAYVALGLLYGKGDFAKTLEISTRSGQDSDCNPSSAAGILGVMLGYNRIPDMWKSGIPKIADTKFEYTSYSFNGIVKSTMDRALKVIERNGGRVQGDQVTIPSQGPKPPKLEQWSMGVPYKRLAAADPAWTWKGGWSDEKSRDETRVTGKAASGAGAEAILKFEGTAVSLVGACSQSGGKADVYLDGKKVGEINAWIPERTSDDALWHTYGLKAGAHTLRIVTRSDSDSRSKGNKILITAALTYK
jgi:hypothetical protein